MSESPRDREVRSFVAGEFREAQRRRQHKERRPRQPTAASSSPARRDAAAAPSPGRREATPQHEALKPNAAQGGPRRRTRRRRRAEIVLPPASRGDVPTWLQRCYGVVTKAASKGLQDLGARLQVLGLKEAHVAAAQRSIDRGALPISHASVRARFLSVLIAENTWGVPDRPAPPGANLPLEALAYVAWWCGYLRKKPVPERLRALTKLIARELDK